MGPAHPARGPGGLAGRARSCSTPRRAPPVGCVDHDGTGAPAGRRRTSMPGRRLAWRWWDDDAPEQVQPRGDHPRPRPSRAPRCAWWRSWWAPPRSPRRRLEPARPGRTACCTSKRCSCRRRRPGVTDPARRRRRRSRRRGVRGARRPHPPGGAARRRRPAVRAPPPSWRPSCRSAARRSPSTSPCCARPAWSRTSAPAGRPGSRPRWARSPRRRAGCKPRGPPGTTAWRASTLTRREGSAIGGNGARR